MRFLLILFITIFSYAQITSNSFRLSYQNLHFQKEHLGLIETSYIFNFNYLYSGIGIYSAVSGKRGGFFTGGILFGIKYPLYKSFYIDSGIFIGGGGGGHAPQGSGLMTKIHAGIIQKNRQFNYGLNINHISFKDSPIHSTQLGFMMDYNFKDIYFIKKPQFKYGKFGINKIVFSPFIQHYIPINSKTTTNVKQKNFSLIGAQISKEYKNFYMFITAAGAFRGNSDGYAEYLIGLGKKLGFFKIQTSIGAGGGGEVKTNGGLIYKIQAQTNFEYLNASIGYIHSPDGFKAVIGGLYLNKKFDFLTVGNKLLKFKPKKMNIKIYTESYLPSNTIRKNQNSKRLDLLNVEIGMYKNNNLLLYFNTASAYNGNSGGYAVGMFGGQYNINKYIFTKLSFGAAGGGNVDVGGGLIAKAEFGIKYKYLFLTLGRIKAMHGRLNTTTLSLGINYDFYKGIIN